MAVPTVGSLAARFQRRANLLDISVNSGNRANRTRRLNLMGLGSLYEASFLSLARSLESFLEEYFLLLLHSPAARVEVCTSVGIVAPASRQEVDAMFDLENHYLDWLPFSRTQERARRFFPDGSPFQRLDRAPQEKEVLRTHHTIRNAVAHESGTAARKFKELPGVQALPRRSRNVSDFLRWVDPVSGLETWATHRAAIGAIVEALAAPSDKGARQFLGPEDPFRVGDRPGAGSYRCRACRSQIKLPYPGSRLKICTRCAGGRSLYDRVW